MPAKFGTKVLALLLGLSSRRQISCQSQFILKFYLFWLLSSFGCCCHWEIVLYDFFSQGKDTKKYVSLIGRIN